MLKNIGNINRVIGHFQRNWVFWVVTLLSFVIYYMTCGRHLTWAHDGADGGDLALSAYVLGCPHPTGYPLYCLTGWLFIRILPFGEVAFRLSLYSALFASLGAGIVAVTIRNMSKIIFPSLAENIRKGVIPLVAGFMVAFSFSYWSQALIVEIYSLNAFFVALGVYFISLIIIADSKEERDKLFLRAAFITGLGFTNHMSMIYFLVAGIITLIYIRYIPSLKVFVPGLILFTAALSIYIYLPIMARTQPIMNWGDPSDLDGFLWILTGQQFQKLQFNSLFFQMLYRIYNDINLIHQFSISGVIAAFWGIAYFIVSRGKKRWAFFILLASVAIVNIVHLANYMVVDPLSFMLPLFMTIGIFAAIGTGWLFQIAHDMASRSLSVTRSVFSGLLLRLSWAAVIVIPVLLMASNYGSVDISDNTSGYDYAVRTFNDVEPGSVVFETYYGRGLTLLHYYHVEGMGKDRGVIPVYDEHLQFDWGKRNFARLYPSLKGPDPEDYRADDIAHSMIERNYDSVTMYFGRMFEPPDGYEFEPLGDLFRVVRIDENKTSDIQNKQITDSDYSEDQD